MVRGLAIVAVITVVGIVAGVIYLDHESRVEYTVQSDDLLEDVLGTTTFTLSADLDEAATVTLWCDGQKLSTILGTSEWTAPQGEWTQMFTVVVPEGLTVDGFYDRLTVEFDGKEGIRI